MAYADQGMSSSKLVSVIIVIIVHVVLGYALISGLAFEAAKKVAKTLDVVDIKEEEPPEEELPPEPEQVVEPPPVVSPPPIVKTVAPPPVVTTVREAPPPPPVVVPRVEAPPPPPPAPPKRPNPLPKGNPGSWASTADYPSRALREERQGVTGFRVTVGPSGRVENCEVTSSSGHADLDDATCKNIARRGRFDPALDSNGNPTTGSWSSRVRWQIPD
jgi:protein TonB